VVNVTEKQVSVCVEVLHVRRSLPLERRAEEAQEIREEVPVLAVVQQQVQVLSVALDSAFWEVRRTRRLLLKMLPKKKPTTAQVMKLRRLWRKGLR